MNERQQRLLDTFKEAWRGGYIDFSFTRGVEDRDEIEEFARCLEVVADADRPD